MSKGVMRNSSTALSSNPYITDIGSISQANSMMMLARHIFGKNPTPRAQDEELQAQRRKKRTKDVKGRSRRQIMKKSNQTFNSHHAPVTKDPEWLSKLSHDEKIELFSRSIRNTSSRRSQRNIRDEEEKEEYHKEALLGNSDASEITIEASRENMGFDEASSVYLEGGNDAKRIAFVWQKWYHYDRGPQTIEFKIYDVGGEIVKDTFAAKTLAEGEFIMTLNSNSLKNGDFLITYSVVDFANINDIKIYGAIYDINGNELRSPFIVSQGNNFLVENFGDIALENGGFVVPILSPGYPDTYFLKIYDEEYEVKRDIYEVSSPLDIAGERGVWSLKNGGFITPLMSSNNIGQMFWSYSAEIYNDNGDLEKRILVGRNKAGTGGDKVLPPQIIATDDGGFIFIGAVGKMNSNLFKVFMEKYDSNAVVVGRAVFKDESIDISIPEELRAEHYYDKNQNENIVIAWKTAKDGVYSVSGQTFGVSDLEPISEEVVLNDSFFDEDALSSSGFDLSGLGKDKGGFVFTPDIHNPGTSEILTAQIFDEALNKVRFGYVRPQNTHAPTGRGNSSSSSNSASEPDKTGAIAGGAVAAGVVLTAAAVAAKKRFYSRRRRVMDSSREVLEQSQGAEDYNMDNVVEIKEGDLDSVTPIGAATSIAPTGVSRLFVGKNQERGGS